MSNESRVARNAIWLIAQPLLVGIVSIVVTAIVARELGTVDYGLMLLLLSYSALFTQLCNLGLRPYSVREIAANHNQTQQIVSDMLALRSVLAVAGILASGALLALVSPNMPWPLVLALFILILLNALIGCFIDGLQGREHMKAVATSFAASGVLVQLANLACIYMGFGLIGIATSYVLGAFAMLVVVRHQFHRLVGPTATEKRGRLRFEYLRLSWAFLLQNIVGTVRNRIDLVIVSSMFGAHGTGIYGSAMVLIQRLDLIQDGISTAIFSRVAYLHGRAPEELRNLVKGSIKVVLVISTPMAVGLYAVSDDVISLMFGDQFRESGLILAILGVAVPFMFTCGVMFNVLRAMSVETAVLKASVFATILTVLFFVGCSSVMRLPGAAVAFVLGIATLTTTLIAIYWRIEGAPWTGRDLVMIIVANSAMAASLWLTRHENLAIKVICAMVVYTVVARLLGLATIAMVKAMFASRAPVK